MSENRVSLIAVGIFLALTVTSVLRAGHEVLKTRPILNANAPKDLSKAQLATLRDAVLMGEQVYHNSNDPFTGHWACTKGNDGRWHVAASVKCVDSDVSEEFHKVCLNTVTDLCNEERPSYARFLENAEIVAGGKPETDPKQKLLKYYAMVAGTQAGTQTYDEYYDPCSEDPERIAYTRKVCGDANSFVKEKSYTFPDDFQTTFAISCAEALDYLCSLEEDAKPKKEIKRPAPWR